MDIVMIFFRDGAFRLTFPLRYISLRPRILRSLPVCRHLFSPSKVTLYEMQRYEHTQPQQQQQLLLWYISLLMRKGQEITLTLSEELDDASSSTLLLLRAFV